MKNRGFSYSMAIVWAVVFGLTLHNWALGICIGLCMGALFGSGRSGAARENGTENAGGKDTGFPYGIRILDAGETEAALGLAWDVFCEFESPEYGPEGTEEFRKTINDEEYLRGIRYYGAFDGEKLAGVLGIRAEQRHICFFFVDGAYQRQGIGTELFRRMLEDFPDEPVTLNSAPYGMPFYTALGFEPAGDEQTVNGIRFTPMVYRKKA